MIRANCKKQTYIYSPVYVSEVAVSGDHTRYSFKRLGLALLDGGGEQLQVKGLNFL
jgi:hypothetical protein